MAFTLTRHFPRREAASYIAAQLTGAALGGLLTAVLVGRHAPTPPTPPATEPTPPVTVPAPTPPDSTLKSEKLSGRNRG